MSGVTKVAEAHVVSETVINDAARADFDSDRKDRWEPFRRLRFSDSLEARRAVFDDIFYS